MHIEQNNLDGFGRKLKKIGRAVDKVGRKTRLKFERKISKKINKVAAPIVAKIAPVVATVFPPAAPFAMAIGAVATVQTAKLAKRQFLAEEKKFLDAEAKAMAAKSSNKGEPPQIPKGFIQVKRMIKPGIIKTPAVPATATAKARPAVYSTPPTYAPVTRGGAALIASQSTGAVYEIAPETGAVKLVAESKEALLTGDKKIGMNKQTLLIGAGALGLAGLVLILRRKK